MYDGKVLRRSSRFGFGWHQEIGSANEGVERMKGKKRVRMWEGRMKNEEGLLGSFGGWLLRWVGWGWDIGNGWKTVAAISPFRDSQNTEKRRGTARLYPGVAPRCVAGLDRF